MNRGFQELPARALDGNVFERIGEQWMLITAGNLAGFGTMTASWGAMGVLWSRPVCFCFVRPPRHTYGFMERATAFSLSFFAPEHRSALEYCGSHSGRDVDKAAAAGLTPVAGQSDTVHFAEARLVIECRKIYRDDIRPEHFLDPTIESSYPDRDYHRMYVGEVLRCLMRGCDPEGHAPCR